MHVKTLGVLAVSALLMGALSTLAPPASATSAQTVMVDCISGTTTNFTVTSGDTIDFQFSGPGCSGYFGSLSADQFLATVNQMTNLSGTGGSIVAEYYSRSVLYQAGTGIGTDSLIVNAPRAFIGTKANRARFLNTAYYMTSPVQNPEPWTSEIGRAAGATCPAGWNPSWAQWPNNNTGGFTCVRTQAWDNSQGTWVYKSGT